MTGTQSRRDFLKTGLAAAAAVIARPRSVRANVSPGLFEKTRIGSLELATGSRSERA